MLGEQSFAKQSAQATARRSKTDFKRELPVLQTQGVNIWDNKIVYLTDVHQQWERQLLLRIIKRIHKLLVSNLTKEEEIAFSLYQNYDANLDGIVAGDEAISLERDIKDKARQRGHVIDEGGKEKLIDDEGKVTFHRLMRWFVECHKEASLGYFAAFSDMLLDNTLADSERRIEGLDLESLRRNCVGYRQMLEDVLNVVEEKRLHEAYAAERTKGLVAAGEEFHKAVVNELTEDEQVMFEAFLQVDSSGDLLLQKSEVESLMKRIEPEADDKQIDTYMDDLNMSEEESLTFVDLMQWWTDAASNGSTNAPNNVIAQKGKQLFDSVKSLALDSKIDGFLTGHWSGKRIWRMAQDRGEAGVVELRDAYVRVMREIRHYKMELALRQIEKECGEL